MTFLQLPGRGGKNLSVGILSIAILAVMIVIMASLRVIVLLNTKQDDPTLIAIVNVLLTAFVTAVAAERVASQYRNGKGGE